MHQSRIFNVANKCMSFNAIAKVNPSGNGVITLPLPNVGKSCSSREFLMSQMSFNAIRENKILAKNSEFTESSKFQYAQ